MITSESVTKLFSALLEAQKSFPPIPKNRTAEVKTKTGGKYSYNYADISDILHAVLPILNKNGIAFSQPHVLVGDRVRVTTRLMHSSGEWMQSDGLPLGEFVNPQELGASSTYMRRYEVCSMLGIVAEDDSDAQELAAPKQASSQSAKLPAFVQPQRPVTPIREREPGDDDVPIFDPDGEMIEHPASIQNREQKQAAQADDSIPSVIPVKADERRVTEPMAKRFIAIAKANGKTWDQINAALKAIGIKDAKELPSSQYATFIEWAGGKNERRA